MPRISLWCIALVVLGLLLIPPCFAAPTITVPLLWDPPVPTAGSPPLVRYDLQRASPATLPMVTIASIVPPAVTFTDTVTLVGETCYHVHADYGAAGVSLESNTLCIHVPGPPLQLSVTVLAGGADGSITVGIRWEGPAGPGDVVTGYRVVRAAEGTGPWELVGVPAPDELLVQDMFPINTRACYQVLASWKDPASGWEALSEPTPALCIEISRPFPVLLRLQPAAP